MEGIDRQLQAAIDARTAGIGGGARPAGVGTAGGSIADRGTRLNESPATVNPGAGELAYVKAAADDAVAERLSGYAGREIAPTGEGVRSVGLAEALSMAQETGREFRTAEEEYALAGIALLIEEHRWSPQLFNDTSVSVGAEGDGGRFEPALSVINTLRASQRLPFGGEVEARWVTSALDQLREVSSGGYASSSEIAVRADVPLMRGAGAVAREELIQSRRSMVYAARTFEDFRRRLLVEVAGDYFDLVAQLASIGNQERDLEAQRRRNDEVAAKVAGGRLDPFQQQITANAVRQSEARLATLRERYVLSLERFRVRLGLDPSAGLDIRPVEIELSPPAVTPEAAAAAALEYRLDLQNRRDQLVDRERAVANARNDLRADLDVFAEVGLETPEEDATGGLGVEGDEAFYEAGATLSLPLNRRIERLTLRRAQLLRDRAQRDYEEFRDGVILEARAAVRAIDLARFQLEIAEQQIGINERGLESLRLRDDADPQSVLDRQNALLDAQNARDQAVTDLRNAVLEYLRVTGQLRVREDGTLEMLGG
jgi:outer membrane protein TolC